MAHFLLKQFSKGLVGAIGGWLDAGNAADQIGHLVIKPVRQHGVGTLNNRIPNDPGLRDTCEPGRFAQTGFDSRIEANAFHRVKCITIVRKM